MIKDEQLMWLDYQKQKINQEKEALINTKKCVQMWRDARNKNMSGELINELFQLLRSAAIDDWGQGTIVDDFNEPPYVVIINGKKNEKI